MRIKHSKHAATITLSNSESLRAGHVSEPADAASAQEFRREVRRMADDIAAKRGVVVEVAATWRGVQPWTVYAVDHEDIAC